MELFYTIAFRDHREQEHYHSKPATLNRVFTLLDYKYLCYLWQILTPPTLVTCSSTTVPGLVYSQGILLAELQYRKQNFYSSGSFLR